MTAGLNKGELKNSLAKAVCFDRLGELRDRTFEAQRHRASGLNLVVGAINLVEYRLSGARNWGASPTRAANRRRLTQACGAGPLEPHQPHRRLLLEAEQTCREGRFPATQDLARTLAYFFPHIPSSGIFRVRVPNWLRVCVSSGKTRNINREARKSSGASPALNPRAGKCAFALRRDARS